MDEEKGKRNLLALFIKTNEEDKKANSNKNKGNYDNEVYDTENGIDAYSEWQRKRKNDGYDDADDKLSEGIIGVEEQRIVLERRKHKNEVKQRTRILKSIAKLTDASVDGKEKLFDYIIKTGEKAEAKREKKEEYRIKFDNFAKKFVEDEERQNIWCKMDSSHKEFAKLRAIDLCRRGLILNPTYSDLFEYYMDEDRKRLYEDSKAEGENKSKVKEKTEKSEEEIDAIKVEDKVENLEEVK